jgi:hypothetical protein
MDFLNPPDRCVTDGLHASTGSQHERNYPMFSTLIPFALSASKRERWLIIVQTSNRWSKGLKEFLL